MIAFLRSLFQREENVKPAPEQSQDILRIAKLVEALVERTAYDIVMHYKDELLAQPITYIVPAVWGVNEKGELTCIQKEIHGKTVPIIKESLQAFGFRDLDAAQEFALGYIIRGLIISKITFMIELLRKQVETMEKDYLSRTRPIGSA